MPEGLGEPPLQQVDDQYPDGQIKQPEMLAGVDMGLDMEQ
jgi:hypothetical protein